MRVALFMPCFNDTLFPETGIAVVRVLERLGHEIAFPEDQTCCGQIHLNTGFRRGALRLARRFAQIFEEAEFVVAPSASCVGTVRHALPAAARAVGDTGLAERLEALGERVHEFAEFLVQVLGVEDVGARYPYRVAYHPTCHALRDLGLGDVPYRLLRSVRDLELVEIPEADQCCGFGGTFAVKNADTSSAMLGDKIDHILASGADVCTALDNSCLMHIGGALSRRGARTRTAHLAEILATTAGDG